MRRSLALICLLLASPAWASPQANDIEKEVAEARQIFFQMGDAVALEKVKKVLMRAPADVGARDLHARCLRNLGRFEEAVQTIESLREVPRETGRVLAECLARIPGREIEAYEVLDKMLEKDPKDFEALVSRARVRLLENSPKEALADAIEARAIQEQNLEVQLILGQSLAADGSHRAAGRVLSELLGGQAKFPPFDPHHLREAVFSLAQVHRMLGQYPAAASFFQQIHGYTPDDHNILGLWADMLFLAGEQEEAVRRYREAAAIEPRDPSIQLRLAGALHHGGKGTEAIVAAEEALKLLKDPTVPTFKLAEYLLDEGLVARATIYAEAAVELLPGDPEVQFIHARVLEKRGEAAAAEAAYRRAIELDPSLFEAMDALGGLLRASRDPDYQREGQRLAELCQQVAPHLPLIQQLRREMFLVPENARLYTSMATLLNIIGQYNAAVPWIAESLRSDGNNPQSHLVAGFVAANTGALHRAMTHFQEVQGLLGPENQSAELEEYIQTIKSGGKLPFPLGAGGE